MYSMSPDNFSQKEILIQLMSKVDLMTTAMNEQKVLLTGITEKSENRDTQISELKAEVKELKLEVEALHDWQTKAMTLWALAVFAFGLIANKLINTIF